MFVLPDIGPQAVHCCALVGHCTQSMNHFWTPSSATCPGTKTIFGHFLLPCVQAPRLSDGPSRNLHLVRETTTKIVKIHDENYFIGQGAIEKQ